MASRIPAPRNPPTAAWPEKADRTMRVIVSGSAPASRTRRTGQPPPCARAREGGPHDGGDRLGQRPRVAHEEHGAAPDVEDCHERHEGFANGGGRADRAAEH